MCIGRFAILSCVQAIYKYTKWRQHTLLSEIMLLLLLLYILLLFKSKVSAHFEIQGHETFIIVVRDEFRYVQTCEKNVYKI